MVVARAVPPAGPELRPPVLHRRVVTILLLGALFPWTVLAVGAWIVFGRLISERSQENLQTLVRSHAASIDLFLDERLAALTLVTRTRSRDEIAGDGRLRQVLEALDASYPGSFQDLGVIDEEGRHLAYVGPYDLLGVNYREDAWFRHVMEEGRFVSDVFRGKRDVPHFILAVRRTEDDGRSWILRATANSEIFERLVSRGRPGRTGDCFLVDRLGRYQTTPASGGALLEPSGVEIPADLSSLRTRSATDQDDHPLVRTVLPILGGRWILVAQEEEAEIREPVRAALLRGAIVFAAGVIVFAAVALLSTRHLVRLIERSLREASDLSARFLHASKLASIGEMATGLAHEINNPLAIIQTEQTNIGDLLQEIPAAAATAEIGQSVEQTKRQVGRCKTITQKMLQFGRQGPVHVERIDPRASLREIVRLLQPQARVNDVDVCFESEDGLPQITMDPSELQQVVTNLVNNAVQAMPAGGAIVVSAWREADELHLTVEDTGSGVPATLREKVFEPFFTTKPVGRGTGLGLSVCYGIVTKWRGSIAIEGAESGGALFHVRLPVPHDLPSERGA